MAIFRKVMTVPVIDGIDMNTWEYRRVYGAADKHFRGIFEWGLLYKEAELPERERNGRQHGSEPFRCKLLNVVLNNLPFQFANACGWFICN